MPFLVRVFCRECDGTADHPDGLHQCGWCLGQGHEDINRAPDGSVPTHHEDTRPVRLWIDQTLPEYPNGTA